MKGEDKNYDRRIVRDFENCCFTFVGKRSFNILNQDGDQKKCHAIFAHKEGKT